MVRFDMGEGGGVWRLAKFRRMVSTVKIEINIIIVIIIIDEKYV